MMDIKDQVCSLELAKRLKELGVQQESLFYWHGYSEEYKSASIAYTKGKIIDKQCYSAFTVAELGELIFKLNYYHLEDIGYLEINTERVYRSGGDFYRLTYNLSENIIDELNEANARALMLIYLIENGLMKNE